MDFTKSLSVMLKSGMAINDALTALSEQSNSKRLGKIITKVRDDIEDGTILSAAFGKESQTFGPVFVSLIRAGEESGTLQGNLQFLAEWLGRNADLKREVAAATLYPKLVFSAALLLGGALAIFILPKLVPLFDKMKVDLPLITKILLSISLFVQHYWFLAIIGAVFIILLFYFSNRVFFIRKLYHLFFIRMPFIGPLLRNYQLALITQLFGTLLKSGLTLTDSVAIVADATTNIHYQEAIRDIKNSIVKGTTLSHSLEKYPALFPKIIISIVSVGEKSGTLLNSFEYLAEYYTKEVNGLAKKLPTVIEPLLLIMIAFIVGFIALAIIMPIYKLTGSISK